MPQVRDYQKICFNYFIINIIIIIFMTVCIQEIINDVVKDSSMAKRQAIKDKILKDYDKTTRPMNTTNTTVIHTHFIPRLLVELDEEKSLFSLDSLLVMQWHDPRLEWNYSDGDDGENYIALPKELLWVPDIIIENSHSARFDPTQSVPALISWDGLVIWVPPMLTQTSCSTASNYSLYPADEVECVVKMGSWLHDSMEIDLFHSSAVDISEFFNSHPRWEVILSKVYVERKQESFVNLNFHFPLKRRPVAAIEATRMPCIMIMLLTLSIFWLPSHSTKKLILGGMLFMVLVALLTYVAGSTRNPLFVLAGVSFIRTTTILVVFTIVIQVFVVMKIAAMTGPTDSSSIVTKILIELSEKYLLLRSSLFVDKLPMDMVQLKEDTTTESKDESSNQWENFAKGLDRFLFVIITITMLAVHHL